MKTIEQTRRELFEAAMDALDKNPGLWMDGGYSNAYGHCAWIGFNAALDAVVIETPECTEFDSPAGAAPAIEACRASIESTNLGLKIR